MAEPRWLDRAVLDAMYADQLDQHGGRPGVRDENALESALARPRNKWAYDSTVDLAALAAAYGYGLATRHLYTDGNTRIAFLAMYVFLGVNGRDLAAPEPEVVTLMRAVADGNCSERQLAAWVRRRIVRA